MTLATYRTRLFACTASVNARLTTIPDPVLVAYALANRATSDSMTQVADTVFIPSAKLCCSSSYARVDTFSATVRPTAVGIALVAVLDVVRARGA